MMAPSGPPPIPLPPQGPFFHTAKENAESELLDAIRSQCHSQQLALEQFLARATCELRTSVQEELCSGLRGKVDDRVQMRIARSLRGVGSSSFDSARGTKQSDRTPKRGEAWGGEGKQGAKKVLRHSVSHRDADSVEAFGERKPLRRMKSMPQPSKVGLAETHGPPSTTPKSPASQKAKNWFLARTLTGISLLRGRSRAGFEDGHQQNNLRRSDTEVLSLKHKEEKREWMLHLRKFVSKRVQQHEQSSQGFVHKIATYFGLKRESQTINLSRLAAEVKPPPENCITRIVNTSVFNMFCASIIIVNAVLIGIQAEIAIENAIVYIDAPSLDSENYEPLWLRTLSIILIIEFILEVSLRLIAQRRFFFFGPEYKWNAFDSVLLIYSLWEELNGGQAFRHLRLLRGIRMIRVLRIVRLLRFFRGLRLMVCSVVQSLLSLTWAIAMLVVFLYLVAVSLLYGITTGIRDGVSEQDRQDLVNLYGSVGGTMWVLLLAVTGGRDWEGLVRPLAELSPIYKWLFAGYVLFVLFGLMNTFTSVFVEQARQIGRLDRDLVIQQEMISNESFMKEMHQIFDEVDRDETGFITWDEFQEYLANDRVQAYFATQKLDTSDAFELFKILADGGDEVDVEEFIIGCMKLKGGARAADLAILTRDINNLNKKLRIFMRTVENQLSVITGETENQPASEVRDANVSQPGLVLPRSRFARATASPVDPPDSPQMNSEPSYHGYHEAPPPCMVEEAIVEPSPLRPVAQVHGVAP